MTTIQSQLDQVLALIRGMPCRCMSVAQLGERDPGCDKCEATEKLEAIRAAVGGEAVAVAWRFVDKTGQYAYSSWVDIGTPIGDHDASRIAIQYAYASPATVGVGIDTDDYEACKQLLAEIREAAGLKEKPGSILERIRELAALIGK